jgi:hypothetical protein
LGRIVTRTKGRGTKRQGTTFSGVLLKTTVYQAVE